jgi:hypothetical protein
VSFYEAEEENMSLKRRSTIIFMSVLPVLLLAFYSLLMSETMLQQLTEESESMSEDELVTLVQSEGGTLAIPAIQELLNDELHDSHANLPVVGRIATAIANQEGPPFSDMDFSNGPSPFCGKHKCNCGYHKCYYRSTSYANTGYLLARGNKQYKTLKYVYQLEQSMHTKYGVFPLSMSPPVAIEKHNISDNMDSLFKIYGSMKGKGYDDLPLAVMKVHEIPKPNLFVGATPNKVSRLKNDIVVFARHMRDIRSFRSHFLAELDRVLAMLDDDEFKHFKRDWQVMIDDTGNWYHIDADRGQLLGKGSKKSRLHKQNVECGMRRVLYYLTRATGSPVTTTDEHESVDDWPMQLENDVLFERRDDETCDENGLARNPSPLEDLVEDDPGAVMATLKNYSDNRDESQLDLTPSSVFPDDLNDTNSAKTDIELLVQSNPDAAIRLLHEYSSSGNSGNSSDDAIAQIAMTAAKREGGSWADIDWSQGPAEMCDDTRCNCGGKKVCTF